MVIRVLPFGAGTTAPRLPLLKSYSFFILFLIYLSFTGCGFPRGNDSNNNIAKCINHNQYSAQKIHADGDKTIFFFVIVFDGDGIFIFKHTNSIGEFDAMFLVV